MRRTTAAKLRGHIERAEAMGQCIPPWLWIDDDGRPEGYIFWLEQLDGLNTLIRHCDKEAGGSS